MLVRDGENRDSAWYSVTDDDWPARARAARGAASGELEPPCYPPRCPVSRRGTGATTDDRQDPGHRRARPRRLDGERPARGARHPPGRGRARSSSSSASPTARSPRSPRDDPDRPWVAHVSGATPLAALDPHERRFGMHPLQSFSKARGPEQLDGAWAAVTAETDERARGRLPSSPRPSASRPFELDDANRAAYHAGAAIASNYLVTLRRAAGSLLEAAGAPPEALDPLMRGVIETGFELTGPIARGDWETVERHLAVIRAERPGARGALPRPRGRDREDRGTRAADREPPVKVVRSIAEARAELRERTGSVGLVPTMGALHAGHLALLEAARDECETVVMSLFVNPAQFSAPADLGRYPRDEERDLSLAERAGVDLVFVPVRGGDVPARLPDLGRGDRARLDPRGPLPPGPLPGRRDGRPQALLDRPPRPRVLRPEGRPAGRGDPAHDPRPRARGRAPRPPHRARRGRPRALVAQRAPEPGRAPPRPRAPARARDPRRPRRTRHPRGVERARRRLRRGRELRPTRSRRRGPRRRHPPHRQRRPRRRLSDEHPPPAARSRDPRTREAPHHRARRDEAAGPADRHGDRLRRTRRPPRRPGRRRPRRSSATRPR